MVVVSQCSHHMTVSGCIPSHSVSAAGSWNSLEELLLLVHAVYLQQHLGKTSILLAEMATLCMQLEICIDA